MSENDAAIDGLCEAKSNGSSETLSAAPASHQMGHLGADANDVETRRAHAALRDFDDDAETMLIRNHGGGPQ